MLETLDGPPDWLALPVGNGGNISAYWKGFTEMGVAPRMLAGQAAGAAPLLTGVPVRDPQTVATAIRIGNPARLGQALAAVSESNGGIRAIDDEASWPRTGCWPGKRACSASRRPPRPWRPCSRRPPTA